MTPKQRAAAEKVIEAWEGPYYDLAAHRCGSIEFVGGMRVAIDALREALAEEEPDVVQAAVLAEREACARTVDGLIRSGPVSEVQQRCNWAYAQARDAIRARGEA